jgi:putative spermidine/putrescine transport system ATP-binding protein
MAMGQGHIELAGVVKSYDGITRAVDGINLKIPDGAYCCFLGPSGCGKTTILRMIAGHEDPTDGEILIGGENVVGLAPVERRTAMMFQSYALFPHLTVRDNIAFALRVRGLSKVDRLKAADAMIEKVRLGELRDRLPSQLSGGQQQRVALARAGSTSPRVQQDLGITFVHVTHTQHEAIALADLVVVMDRGHIKQSGPARDVYAFPRDRYVAEFLGGQNVISGRIEAVADGFASIRPPDLQPIRVPHAPGLAPNAGSLADIAVRRDDIDLLRPTDAGLDARLTALPGRVRALEYQGSYVKVMLDPVGADEFIVYVPERKFYQRPFQVGDLTLAAWDVDHARLLA